MLVPDATGRFWRFLRRPLSASRLASAGLVLLLVALPGFALWGAVSTWRAGEAARDFGTLSDAFDEARYQIGAEESLERKYRLEPGAEVRQRHAAAAAAMLAALERARLLASTGEVTLIDDVIARHAQYMAAIGRMFDAVDAGDAARTSQIDEHEVDPVFDSIEPEILAAATASRVAAARQLQDLARLQTRVVVATPVVFLAGLALVAFFWSVLRSYQARVKNTAEREARIAQRNEERFRLLVQNSSDVVLVCTEAGVVTYQSPAARTAWGFGPDSLRDASLFGLVHPEELGGACALLEQARDARAVPRRGEVRMRDGAGAWRYAELILTNLLHEPAVAGVVATIHDIDERKAFERQLTQRAFYDPLTGLPNRALLRDRLDQALVRAGGQHGAVGVMFLDLDNFKLVNDSLGHQAGDALLLAAAGRLQDCVRKQDTVARLGGDEFVVILEGLAAEADALAAAACVVTQFAQPFALDGRSLVVNASVGVALADAAQHDVDGLLRNADLAMYRAKSGGKGRYVVFDPSMHADALARLELEADLRHAIARRQLRVHYQPIVALGSGRVTEFEALLRWQHPTRGLVPPLDFIGIAEETGLIGSIGSWVLHEACRQAARWQQRFPADPPLRVSVNLSPRQFQDAHVVEMVARTLEQTGLAPGCLKLEITEGVVMRDVDGAIDTLTRLKRLGVQIAVDDFGTGYSSLAYLKRLPLDVLKIDRAFVNGIGQNSEDNAIVQAILSMARSLGLTVTAEGIETAEQAATLDAWACERGQGFHFARPLDADAATSMLAARAGPDAAEAMLARVA